MEFVEFVNHISVPQSQMKYFLLLLRIIYLHDLKQINLLLVEICRGKIYLQVLFQQ